MLESAGLQSQELYDQAQNALQASTAVLLATALMRFGRTRLAPPPQTASQMLPLQRMQSCTAAGNGELTRQMGRPWEALRLTEALGRRLRGKPCQLHQHRRRRSQQGSGLHGMHEGGARGCRKYAETEGADGGPSGVPLPATAG
jgi:hypothetical protein